MDTTSSSIRACNGRLHDKVAIVTGASSGLGRAISLAYMHQGARVVCADLTPDARLGKPEEPTIATHLLIEQEGGESIFVKTDVGDGGDMENLVRMAVKQFGKVDM